MMSKHIQELLWVTQNFRNLNKSTKDYIKPEFIKNQYDDYNNQIHMINEVFQSSMRNTNKFKENDEALKRSSHLLKRSMLVAIDDQK